MFMPELLTTRLFPSYAEIKLDRAAKRNALTRSLIEEFDHQINLLRADLNLRLLVLSAAGPVFCPGMDLDEMQSRARSENGKTEWLSDSEKYCQLLQNIFSCPFPVIAQLQGPVLAGGVGIVLACDMIVASSNAFFSLPEPARGITAAIVTPLLVHRAGCGVASQLLLSGERFSAERAFQLGLVHAVVSQEDLTERMSQLRQSILTGSPSALAITKQHLNSCASQNVIDQLRESIQISATARETPDAREGLSAFLEKRKPSWQSG